MDPYGYSGQPIYDPSVGAGFATGCNSGYQETTTYVEPVVAHHDVVSQQVGTTVVQEEYVTGGTYQHNVGQYGGTGTFY